MATLTWVGADYALWDAGSSWSGGVAPTFVDDVVFTGINRVTISGTNNRCRNVTSAGGITRFYMSGTSELAMFGNSLDFTGIYDIEKDATGTGTFSIRGSNAVFEGWIDRSDAFFNIQVVSGAALTLINYPSPGDIELKPDCYFALLGGTFNYTYPVYAGFIKLDGATIVKATASTTAYFYSTGQTRFVAFSLEDFYIDYANVTIDAGFTGGLQAHLVAPNTGITKVFYGDDTVTPASTVNLGVDVYVTGTPSGSNGHVSITGGVRNLSVDTTTYTTYSVERLYGSLTVGLYANALAGQPQMVLTTVAGESAITKSIYSSGGDIPGITFNNTSGSPTTWTLNVGSGNSLGDFTFTSPNVVFNLNSYLEIEGDFNASASASGRIINFTSPYNFRANNITSATSTGLTFNGTPDHTYYFYIRVPSSGTTHTFNSGALTNYRLGITNTSVGGTIDFTGNVERLGFANAVYTTTGSLNVYGPLSLGGPNPTINTSFTMVGAGTQILDGNNATVNSTFTVNKPGTTLQLTSPFNVSSSATLTHTAGTFDFNGQTCSIGTFNSSNTNTRTVAIGDSTISITGSGTAWNCGTSTNLTVTYGAAGRINMNSGLAKTFAGGGKIWPTVNQGGTGTLSVTGNNTFLNFTNTVTGCTIAFPSGTTTFTNFNVKGAFGSLVTMSSTSTLSKATGTVSVNYLNLSNSTATGGANWYAGTSSIDGGGNSGWQFIGSSSGGGFLAFF